MKKEEKKQEQPKKPVRQLSPNDLKQVSGGLIGGTGTNDKW